MAVVVALGAATLKYLLPRLDELSDVWVGVRAMTWRELAVLAVAATAHIAIAGTVLLASTPGLRYRQAVVVNQSANAASNTIPGGTALALGLVYKIFGSWGFSRSRSTLAITLSGAWNVLTKLAMAVAAVLLLIARGAASGAQLVAGLAAAGALAAGVALIAVTLGREDLARRAGETAGRVSLRLRRRLSPQPTDGWGQATGKFRDRLISVISRRWTRLTVAAVASYLSLYLILILTLRAAGVSNDDVNWINVLTALAFVRLVTVIPLSPGGLGIVEVGLVTGLTPAGGERAAVIAAVLVYRLLTYGVPTVLGFLTYLYWRRNTSWRASAPPFDPHPHPSAWQPAESAA